MTALLTRTGIELEVGPSGGQKGSGGAVKLQVFKLPAASESSTRAFGKFVWRGKQRLRGESNYFIGSDSRNWHTHVAHYQGVEADKVLPGITMVIYGSEGGIEYDLRVAPGTDVDRLRLNLSGADGIRVDTQGNLVVDVAGKPLLMRKPVIFTEPVASIGEDREIDTGLAAVKARVDGGYVLEQDGSVGFRVGPHSSSATLVLDPSLSVAYATFLGGAGEESANSMAIDSTGKVYVAGTTNSANPIPEPGGNLNGPGGGTDFFIAKIDPSASGLNSLLYLTFLGGSGNESGGQIAVDSVGNVAIMGTTTSTDYPVTDSTKRTSGANDLVVSEIGPSGAPLIFSTLFGGSGPESTLNAGGIAFDKSGNIFVASDTNSSDLATTPGALHTTYGGGSSDGFLAIFRPTLMPHLEYCTFLGISAQVSIGSLAIDAGGNAYIAGSTTDPGTSFVALNAFQTSYGGDPSDGFLMKIRPSGNGVADLAYGTFLGGSGLDKVLAVAVGAAMPATAYVTGTTESTNFPINATRTGPQTSLKGTASAFFAAIAQDATTGMTSLTYSTFLGGSESDQGQSVGVSAPNAVYVVGKTSSHDFPWLNNFQPFNGNEDAFVAKLDPTAAGAASLIYSSPLGGTSPPGATAVAEGNAIAVSLDGNVYVAGRTTASDFPRAGNPGNGFQTTCASCQASPPLGDAFVLGIHEGVTASPSVSFTAQNINFGSQSVGAQNVPPLFAGLINTGTVPLNVSSLGITGPNAADFALVLTEPCMTAPIPPGPACSFEVTFAPSIVGPEKAFLTFSDDGPGSPQVFEILGTGNGPLAVAAPLNLVFGNQPAGTSSSTQIARVTNVGNQNLIFTNFGTGGAGIGQFTVQGDPSCPVGRIVAPGNSCTFEVTFVPTTTGQFHAEIDVFDDSGNVQGAEQIISLSGTGTPPAPVVNLLPAQLTFGTQAAGTVSGAQSVTLKNAGSTALTITGIGLNGNDTGSFGLLTVGASPCPFTGGTLGIGMSCTVAVDFAPQSAGTKNANLSVADNASGSPQLVPITGGAIAPAIQISPGSLNFAAETVGIPAAAQTVILTNTGNGPLAISNISLTGANIADFNQTNNCPPSLGNGIPCTLSVTFIPTAGGNRTASINIVDNAPGNPHSVPLTGIGAVPSASIVPTTIGFAPQLVGTSSAPVDIVVTNTGTGSLVITKISVNGPNAADFAETDNCGVSISPSRSCTIHTVLAPTTIGSKTAVLVVADNAPGSPQSVAISGSGMDFSIGAATGATTSATVTAGNPAVYQLQVASLNGFAGTVTFQACTGEPVASACEVTPAAVVVSANSASPFQVNVSTGIQSVTLPTNVRPFSSASPRHLARQNQRMNLVISWMIVLVLLGLAIFTLHALMEGQSGQSRTSKPVHANAMLTWMLIAGTLVCCGGSGGGPAGNPGTPSGTSTLILTATSGGRKQVVPLTLTVLPTAH